MWGDVMVLTTTPSYIYSKGIWHSTNAFGCHPHPGNQLGEPGEPPPTPPNPTPKGLDHPVLAPPPPTLTCFHPFFRVNLRYRPRTSMLMQLPPLTKLPSIGGRLDH
jgi:hypothetical protein